VLGTITISSARGHLGGEDSDILKIDSKLSIFDGGRTPEVVRTTMEA
jgi:hypothetical protein